MAIRRMKISPKNRQYVLVGGWLATAAVAFAFGRMTGWLDTPTAPPQAASSKAVGGGTSAGGLSNGNESGVGMVRQDGQFATDHTGTPQTVGQITGGQPLEDWLKKLMAQEDDIYRMQNFMKLLETMNSPEDIKTALKVIGSSRGGGRGPGGFFGGRMTEYGMLMEKFTQMDPKGAIAYAGEQQGPERFMATASAVRTWTRLDPAAALSWAQTEGANLQMDFGGRGGPGGGGGEEGQPRENFALMGVVTQLAKTDLDKAISAASTAEMGRMSGRMVETLAAEMIGQRGDDAARKLVDTLPDGSFKNEYIQQLAGRLANKDAAGAAQWALTLPAGDAKRRALGEAVQELASKDVVEAGKFMLTVPAGPDTDSARERLAGAAARTDASGALKWAETISDAERKTRTIMSVTETALRTQPEVGKQILEAASLTPEQKTQVAARAASERGGRGGRPPGGGGGGR